MSLAFFFFSVRAQGKAKKEPQKTSGRCWAEVTENVEGRSHFSFFLRSEPGTGANLQKMWRTNRTFFLRSDPGTGASFLKMWKVDRTFFFCGLNLEQVPGRAYRKCGEGIALFFFFFLRSEPGTGARPRLQKLRRVDRIFFFW